MNDARRFHPPLLLHAFLWAIGLSYGFADWAIYRDRFLLHPDWKPRLHGGIDAPFQYRIGNWMVVDWMHRFFHVRPYDTLTLIDVLCLVFALWAILHILQSSSGFQSASPGMQWLAIAAVLVQAKYYLAWGHWFQAEEMLPSILFVALSMALMEGTLVRNKLFACFLLIVLSCIQGFIRADVAVILHAGFFLGIVFKKIAVPLGRVRQAITSVLAAFFAGCVQLYLMFIKFPHAKYGPGGAIRLVTNAHPGMWLTMLLALFPYWLLLGFLIRRRYRANGPETLLIVASLLYLALWAVVGLLDEVRIFLPFAFALMPAAAMALISALHRGGLDVQVAPVAE